MHVSTRGHASAIFDILEGQLRSNGTYFQGIYSWSSKVPVIRGKPRMWWLRGRFPGLRLDVTVGRDLPQTGHQHEGHFPPDPSLPHLVCPFIHSRVHAHAQSQTEGVSSAAVKKTTDLGGGEGGVTQHLFMSPVL